jgi:hypothetical protein
MTVAFDAGSESDTGSSGSTGNYSWSHVPVSAPKGVVVFVFYDVATLDRVTAVSYGGVALTAVAGGNAVDTAGEAGNCQAWFLGSGIPTGTQTVSVTQTGTALHYGVAVSVTAAADTNVTGVLLDQENMTLSEKSVDDGSPGTNSLRLAGVYSGLSTPPSAGANSTDVASIILGAGARSQAVVRETVAGQGARSVGFSSGTSDDVAAVYLAVRENVSGLTITSVTPSSFDSGVAGIVIAGSNFGASQGSSTVDIGAQAQTVTAWSNTSITITSARGSNSMGAGQLKVTIR